MRRVLRRTLRLVGGHRLRRFRSVDAVYRRLSPVYLRFLRWLREPYTQVDGHILELDENDSLNLSVWGRHEPLVGEVIREVLRPGDTAVDVGAHVGYFTLMMARQVGPQGKVFALEPDPQNYQLLKRNVERNGYRNVVLFPYAALDREETVRLYRSRENRGDNRLFPRRKGESFVEVQGVRLDRLLPPQEVPSLRLVKVDVQGAEGRVLRGMEQWLRDKRSLHLVCEYDPQAIKAVGEDPWQYLLWLKELGFSLWDLDEKRGEKVRVAAEELYEKYREGSTNLYCIKE